jgi:uncharacterized membrane protein YphA (DoxX/SURF4 family)
MRLLMRPQHLPARIATGVFIINSGVGKLQGNDEMAAGLHGFASGAYPFLHKLKAKNFTRLLGITEVALGSALVLPIVPSFIAGAGLAAFSGGLLGLYARTPGMRRPGTPLPTQEGIPLAKDIWMTGIGLSLVLDDLTH